MSGNLECENDGTLVLDFRRLGEYKLEELVTDSIHKEFSSAGNKRIFAPDPK